MGKVHPVDDVGLYVNEQGNISFNYWHQNKDQLVNITGENPKIVNITESDRYKLVYTSTYGANRMYFPKGDIVIRSNIYFAFHKENLFHPFLLRTHAKSPNYLVYDGNYKSWIYKEDNVGIQTDSSKIKNIKLVFEHEAI